MKQGRSGQFRNTNIANLTSFLPRRKLPSLDLWDPTYEFQSELHMESAGLQSRLCSDSELQRPKFRRYEVYKVQIWSNAFLNNGHRIRYSVLASKAANFPRTPLPYENFRLFSWSIKRFDRFKYFLQTKAPGSIFCLRMLCLRSSKILENILQTLRS